MATKYFDKNLTTGANDGSSLADAYQSEAALTAGVSSGDEVKVADGIHVIGNLNFPVPIKLRPNKKDKATLRSNSVSSNITISINGDAGAVDVGIYDLILEGFFQNKSANGNCFYFYCGAGSQFGRVEFLGNTVKSLAIPAIYKCGFWVRIDSGLLPSSVDVIGNKWSLNSSDTQGSSMPVITSVYSNPTRILSNSISYNPNSAVSSIAWVTRHTTATVSQNIVAASTGSTVVEVNTGTNYIYNGTGAHPSNTVSLLMNPFANGAKANLNLRWNSEAIQDNLTTALDLSSYSEVRYISESGGATKTGTELDPYAWDDLSSWNDHRSSMGDNSALVFLPDTYSDQLDNREFGLSTLDSHVHYLSKKVIQLRVSRLGYTSVNREVTFDRVGLSCSTSFFYNSGAVLTASFKNAKFRNDTTQFVNGGHLVKEIDNCEFYSEGVISITVADPLTPINGRFHHKGNGTVTFGGNTIKARGCKFIVDSGHARALLPLTGSDIRGCTLLALGTSGSHLFPQNGCTLAQNIFHNPAAPTISLTSGANTDGGGNVMFNNFNLAGSGLSVELISGAGFINRAKLNLNLRWNSPAIQDKLTSGNNIPDLSVYDTIYWVEPTGTGTVTGTTDPGDGARGSISSTLTAISGSTDKAIMLMAAGTYDQQFFNGNRNWQAEADWYAIDRGKVTWNITGTLTQNVQPIIADGIKFRCLGIIFGVSSTGNITVNNGEIVMGRKSDLTEGLFSYQTGSGLDVYLNKTEVIAEYLSSTIGRTIFGTNSNHNGLSLELTRCDIFNLDTRCTGVASYPQSSHLYKNSNFESITSIPWAGISGAPADMEKVYSRNITGVITGDEKVDILFSNPLKGNFNLRWNSPALQDQLL